MTDAIHASDAALDDVLDERVDAELRLLCDESWQLHRELAAMQGALRAANFQRPVLPAGLSARPVMARVLAAPYVPCGVWHQELVTADYAFACSGARRVEQLRYDHMQQGLQRQLRESTERTLRLQQLAERNSQPHRHPGAEQPEPQSARHN